MVSKLDESVGAVIKALDENSMLENSIIVFLSDNGAPVIGLYSNWGSNYPFRGQKQTLWEGGVRTPAVVWSPLIKNPSRVSYNLMHITDWLPTLLTAAGHKPNNVSIDGINQWQSISKDITSPRDHLVVEIDERSRMRAIVVNHFKYIKGSSPYTYADPRINSFLNFKSAVSPGEPKYNIEELMKSPAWGALQKYSTDPNLHYKVNNLRQESTVMCDHDFTRVPSCKADTPCLFNVLDDPCEQNNIANLYPKLVYSIEELLATYERTIVSDIPIISDPASNPEFFNDTWSTWVS